MTGVPRHTAEHRLNVREGCSPIRQKKRGQAPERNKAIQEEVEKLVNARIMKEVHYHNWLSSPVMVKKHDESWRMCVDFKDLNKACPQDATAGDRLESRISLRIPLQMFPGCVQGMPFGLKNAGATYQRLVDKTFQRQIGSNLELAISETPQGRVKAEWETSMFKQEAEAAFKQIKKLIAELPMLTAPKEKEELIIYLAAAKEAISAILMTKREGKQIPPIKQLLSNSEISERMLKWKFELEGYGIQYRLRASIKGQILATFIVERPEEGIPLYP
ncbi:reverse transcriptase domain-containing protein [Tanacetum coccineum]